LPPVRSRTFHFVRAGGGEVVPARHQ